MAWGYADQAEGKDGHSSCLSQLNRRAFLKASGTASVLLTTSLLAACGRPPLGASSSATPSGTTGSTSAAVPAQTSTAASHAASAAVSSGVKELTFLRPSSGPEEDKAYLAMLSGWAKEHPGMPATLETLPNADYNAKVFAEIASGEAHDVTLVLPGDLGSFAVQHALRPLTLYVDKSTSLDKQDFFPAHWLDGQYLATQFGLPPAGSPVVVAYNLDQFQANAVQPPAAAWTWNDCLTVCQRLTKRAGGETTVFGASLSNLFSWLFANDANVLDMASNKETIDSPNAVAALQFLGDLINKYHVSPSPAEAKALGGNPFLAGKLAMTTVNRGALGTGDATAHFKIGVVPLPVSPTTGHSGSQVTAGQMTIEISNKRPDDAWTLLQFLASGPSQLARVTQYGGFPSRRSVATDPKFLASVEPSWVGPEVNRVFTAVAAAKGTSFIPNHPRWTEINTALNAELALLWSGQRPASVVAREAASRIGALLA